jgi:hypothetical protein
MVICMRVYCAQCIPLCAAEVHSALHVQNSVCVCCTRSSVASLIHGVGTCSLLTIVLISAAAAAALMVVHIVVLASALPFLSQELLRGWPQLELVSECIIALLRICVMCQLRPAVLLCSIQQ